MMQEKYWNSKIRDIFRRNKFQHESRNFIVFGARVFFCFVVGGILSLSHALTEQLFRTSKHPIHKVYIQKQKLKQQTYFEASTFQCVTVSAPRFNTSLLFLSFPNFSCLSFLWQFVCLHSIYLRTNEYVWMIQCFYTIIAFHFKL